MKNLQTNFSLISPKLIQKNEKVHAFFTLKNEENVSGARSISGLNLGFNTPEAKEVVAQNRLALLSSLGLDPKWVAYADQVHNNRVRVVTEGGTYPSTDGLVTRIPGLTLGIQVADCAAVLLWDATNNVIGALHAGWRGAAGDIALKGVDTMVEQGADPNKIKVFVSPCLSKKNFEVGQEVAEQFPEEFVDFESYAKPHLDLKGFLRFQMVQSGIPEEQLEIREECTIDDPENFYSYRREGKQSGRMMALIQITE